MLVNTTYRTSKSEILDDFELQGEELNVSLQDIARVNKWLGGNAVTLSGIEELLNNFPKEKTVTIVDIGCGNGDMLREIANHFEKKDRKLELIGIDANANTIQQAEALSQSYPNISYKTIDIFGAAFLQLNYDIGLCTLTLHHFKDQQITEMIPLFTKQSNLGVVINDLHRSKWAYYLFKIVSSIFIKSEIARHDGLISILRGFKKDELKAWAKTIEAQSSIKWKWAFRYQWIIKK
ncbi:methyltransferase domain-containing protein [Aquimarina brevivitae]|uniref:Methyltransferase domain-containing protein n=1 Tax=Aquimarina brevivitae TaxID=323412 RepID=A0A4Q7P1U7_9FLAO|nr:methyltransferase domain-containing protein [Aquimarina brevivitae]RZS93836.1 hypothetical protein EV197_2417 [Aquimarina brevivitae]